MVLEVHKMQNNSTFIDGPREVEFKRSMWIVTWVTLVLPPVTGIFMLSFVGVFPFPEVFYPFIDYAAIVVFCASFFGIRVTQNFIRDIIQLAKSPDSLNKHKKRLKRLPLYYFSILFIYFAAGLVSTLYSLSSLHGFNYTANKYIISFLGVIPGGLITALPIFFYLTDTLGKYLAPHGVHISVTPIKLKLIVLGLFVPVLIDTLLIMYFYDRTGYLALETIGIWFFLIVIAAIGTFMAWQSFRQSLSPFVTALDVEQGDHANIHIIPQSLDELGLLSHRWQNLWLKVLDYEKRLDDANISLKSDVLESTRQLDSERQFIDKVLENANALIVVLDRDGHIVRFNPECEKITGFSFYELRNKPIWEWLIPPEQHVEVKQIFSNLTDAGLDSKYENDLVKCDGDRVRVAWNNSTIKDESGKVQYVVSIGIDVSNIHAAQQALHESKVAAEKASHAKSEFLSRMSHELRTPMNAVLGFGQLLQTDNSNLTADQKEFIEEIMQGGTHLLALINEVLDLAKIEEGKFDVDITDVDLSKVISESISLLKPQAQQCNISLFDNTQNNNNYIIKADKFRLKQAFINLLSNAIKYNSDNGEVHIEINPPSKNKIRILVRDTGPGIPLDMLDKLFIPFERLDNLNSNTIEGTGIGLALSKRIIKLMHGDIGVESRPGHGCTFYIDIPYVSNDAQISIDPTIDDTKTTETDTETLNKTPRYTVLYVEDNPSNLRLVSHAIQKRPDIQLISAHTGTLGLDMAISHLPDLILLDINLPGINGMDILYKLKHSEQTKHIPVVAVTANAMPRDVEAGLTAGFNDYLIKPLDIVRFREILQSYLPKT